MPKSVDSLISFNAGELSPLLDARVDQQKYRFGCRQLKNFIATKTGAATRRPGTQFIAQAKYIKGLAPTSYFAVRVIKFVFSPQTTFVLEMGHQYVRIYQNGAQVNVTSAPTWVNGTHYYDGNFVTDPTNGLIYVAGSSFISTSAPSTGLQDWSQQTILEVVTPYGARYNPLTQDPHDADIFGVKFCQINDVVYFVHPNYPPQKLTAYSNTNWQWEEVQFMSPALLDQNVTGIGMNAASTTGSGVNVYVNTTAWATTTSYVIGDAVNNASKVYVCQKDHTSGTNFTSDLNLGLWSQQIVFTPDNVGGYLQLTHIRPASVVSYDLTGNGTSSSLALRGNWTWQSYGTWNADIALQQSTDNGATWNTIRTIVGRADTNFIQTGTATENVLLQMVITNWASATSTTTPRVSISCESSTLNGIAKITSYVSETNVKVDVIQPFYSNANTTTWSEGAWSNRRGYPTAVTSYQSRMVYAGSGNQPQRIWMTKTNDIENFDLGDASLATDAVVFDLNAPSGGKILWLAAQVDMFAGLSGQEWIINSGTPGTGGSPITPTNISASQQSSWGSAQNLPGFIVGDGVFYSQRNGTTIRQFQFSIATQKYMSQDLMSLSQHLSASGIKNIDFQPQFENQGVFWMVNGLGQLCGMTYEIDQQVYGWHRHVTGEDTVPLRTGTDSFESVCCIPGQSNNDDEVWVSVARYVHGQENPNWYIERLNPYNWQAAGSAPDANKAFYVDSGVQYTSPGSATFTGLTWLAYRPVVALVNSQAVIGLQVSASGSVTIPNYTPAAGDIVTIGLAINYALQPMRLDADSRTGNTQSLTKNICDIYLRVYNSLGGSVQAIETSDLGTTYGTTVPLNYRLANDPLGQSPALFTGEKRITPFSDYSSDASFAVVGSDPLPLTVLACIIKYDLSGTP